MVLKIHKQTNNMCISCLFLFNNTVFKKYIGVQLSNHLHVHVCTLIRLGTGLLNSRLYLCQNKVSSWVDSSHFCVSSWFESSSCHDVSSWFQSSKSCVSKSWSRVDLSHWSLASQVVLSHRIEHDESLGLMFELNHFRLFRTWVIFWLVSSHNFDINLNDSNLDIDELGSPHTQIQMSLAQLGFKQSGLGMPSVYKPAGSRLIPFQSQSRMQDRSPIIKWCQIWSQVWLQSRINLDHPWP